MDREMSEWKELSLNVAVQCVDVQDCALMTVLCSYVIQRDLRLAPKNPCFATLINFVYTFRKRETVLD